MHGSLNDSYTYLHKGTKVRKMHTSRRDTFRSINYEPIAKIKQHVMDINPNYKYAKRNENELKLTVLLKKKSRTYQKSFPGICEELIDYHIDKGYKGLVIEGTGLGHVPDKLIAPLARAHDENIPVVMTSQCLYGRVNMNVYSTGREILNAGVSTSLEEI